MLAVYAGKAGIWKNLKKRARQIVQKENLKSKWAFEALNEIP